MSLPIAVGDGMTKALPRALSAAALCLGIGACAAPPGYWGTETTPPASAFVNWDQYAAYQGQPRVDYPGTPIYGNTLDGGSFGGR
jgi:hypothetical protein